MQGSLPAISLPSQCAVLSAFVNDVEPEMMYAQLVYGYAKGDDWVIGISTSVNSKNVVNAVDNNFQRVAHHETNGAKIKKIEIKIEESYGEIAGIYGIRLI